MKHKLIRLNSCINMSGEIGWRYFHVEPYAIVCIFPFLPPRDILAAFPLVKSPDSFVNLNFIQGKPFMSIYITSCFHLVYLKIY